MVQQKEAIKGRSKLFDIMIMRAVATIMVVAFHVYGVMYANHFPAMREKYYSMYYVLNQCILINIAMPLFIFVSGYLFIYLFQKQKYPTIGFLIKNKIKRLIIPYLFFGIIMMIYPNTLDIACLLSGTYAHLWFLPMLFWCFVLFYLLIIFFRNICLSHWCIIVLVVSFICSFYPYHYLPFPCMGLHYLEHWFCWFCMGGCVYVYKGYILNIMSKYKLLPLFLFVYLVIIYFFPRPYGKTIFWYNSLAQILMLISIWYICQKINWNSFKYINLVDRFNRYSFGVYIFHCWILPYLISSTSKRLFLLEKYAEYTILFPFVLFIVTLILSYILTILLYKVRIGRFLIG